MADFDTGDVVRLGMVQKTTIAGDIVSVANVQITAGGGLAFAAASQDLQEWADTLWATVAADISNTQTADHISIKNMSQDTVWGNIAWNAYSGGTDVADPTAPQVALLVWGRTNRSRVQLRKYLGVFTEPDMTSGEWSAGVRSLAQNFIDYLITGHTMTNGMVLRGCAYRESDARVTFAVTGTTTANPVIQRRRRSGAGS